MDEIFGTHTVCELAASYPRVRELAEAVLEDLFAPERDAVLCRTAARTYRLARDHGGLTTCSAAAFVAAHAEPRASR